MAPSMAGAGRGVGVGWCVSFCCVSFVVLVRFEGDFVWSYVVAMEGMDGSEGRRELRLVLLLVVVLIGFDVVNE